MTENQNRSTMVMNRLLDINPRIAYKIVSWGSRYKSVMWFGVTDGLYSLKTTPKITDISREVSYLTGIRWSKATGYTLCTDPDLVAHELKQRFPTLEVEKL